jgi:flagellum-specific peptidoglycan hydrolase FlgJ
MNLVKNIKILFLGIFIILGIQKVDAQAKNYIQKFKPIADSLGQQYGIPGNVILGIAMQESAYGQSRVCRLLKNHFGIVGKNNLRKTHNIKSRYKAYENDTASFVHFCNYVAARKYYVKLNGSTDVRAWLNAIGRAGYCRHPKQWVRAIMSLLKRNRLV